MINLQDKKRRAYQKDGDLSTLEEELKEYWDISRTRETKTIEDLEKYLWLANAAAATVAIAYIQKASAVSWLQYCGAWAFIAGILMLVLMKYLSAYNSSRDRARFQEAKSKFDADEVSAYIFKEEEIKDKTYHILRKYYLLLQHGAGLAFLAGCVLTLIGVTVGHV